jgi:hypothetical protein
MKEEIVTPTISKDGKPFAGKKHSVTIDDLSEGYKHTYKSFWWVVRRSDKSFVCKAKSKDHAKQIIKNCKCQDIWRPESRLEDEKLLQERAKIATEQRQNTHKFLDARQRYKTIELAYDRNRISEQNKITNAYDKRQRALFIKNGIGVEGLRKSIKERASRGEETYDDREILTAFDIETAKKDLIKSLMR